MATAVLLKATPARAGMNRLCRHAGKRRDTGPRSCGDGPGIVRWGGSVYKASPHTRGWTATA